MSLQIFLLKKIKKKTKQWSVVQWFNPENGPMKSETKSNVLKQSINLSIVFEKYTRKYFSHLMKIISTTYVRKAIKYKSKIKNSEFTNIFVPIFITYSYEIQSTKQSHLLRSILKYNFFTSYKKINTYVAQLICVIYLRMLCTNREYCYTIPYQNHLSIPVNLATDNPPPHLVCY